MIFSTVQIVLLTINANFFILSIFLYKNRNGHAMSNKIMAATIILLAYVNTHFVFLYDKQIYLSFPHLIGTHTPFLFLLPPLLFFFYKSVFDSSYNLKKLSRWHLAPAVFVAMLYMPLYFSSITYKINFIKTGVCYFPFYLLGALFFTHLISYMVMIFWDISKKINVSKKILSSYLLRYLQVARILSGVLVVIMVVTYAMAVNLIYIPILTSLVYYFIIYQLLTHPEIFFSCKYATQELSEKKYKSNELVSSVIDKIYNEVELHMSREKSFLNFEISLPELAYQLNIPTHQLSQVINRKSNLNFNDFINRYRSESSKSKLLDDEYRHYTIEAIGELSGFRSRQTFIKSFKKFYNLTPSEYMKINRSD